MERKAGKQIYRIVAALLVATMLTTSVTPLSYASDRPNAEPQGELICGFTEHMHTQELCCEEVQTLTCALEETEGHSHTKKCYDTERILVCDLDEGTAADTSGSGLAFVRFAEDNSTDSSISFAGHTHSRSCYDTDKTLVCDLAEQEAHWHVDTCYTTESMLRCILPIHVHTDSCYAKEEEPKFTQQILTTTGSGVSVSGILPEGAALQVRDLTDEEYEALPVELDTLLFAYDITILVDGEAYQPETPVTVSVTPQMMTYSLRGPMPSITVHHVTGTDDNGDAEVETVARNAMNDEGTVTFMADSFSVYYGVMQTVEESNIIYFDLSAGDVTIDGNGYSGKIFSTENGTTTSKTISGDNLESKQYYVYQSIESNRAATGEVDGVMVLPQYDRVDHPTDTTKLWGDYITNNTDVTAVIDAWNSTSNREATPNKITVEGTVDATLTIDNIYSSHQIDASTGSKRSSKRTAGISFDPTSSSKTSPSKLNIVYKGDNRVGNISYYSASTSNELKFSGEADATLTVANLSSNSNDNFNYWCSAIGGSDSPEAAQGIIIESGILYAGTTRADDCTAIGGGGNGSGIIIINGGTTTAVSSSSGTAIGGGIGKSDKGGEAHVTINNGTIYAYNFSSAWKSTTGYIPAAAIGGGSSAASTCNECTVTINNGTIYAQSLGGTAIGGGSSADTHGGKATVIINGGTVQAKSIAGNIGDVTIPAGASIGGGTGGTSGDGGDAAITINGGTVITGSMGGGGTIGSKPNYKIGNAEFTVSGGTIHGQAIMAAGANKACTFTMTGGTWTNNTDDSYIYLQPDGGAVWMDDTAGVATLSGGTIQNCTAENGGAIYMTAGTFTLSGTGKIENCVATGDSSNAGKGGAVYLGSSGSNKGRFTMTGGTISGNKANDVSSNYGLGGAIYLDGGDAAVSGGTIGGNNTPNSAYDGGGAYLAGGTLYINGGTVAYNTAANNGGGAYVAGGNVNVTGGNIENNTASQNGGGIYVQDGNYTQVGGNVSNNTATNGKGGGVFASANTANVAAKILSGNVSSNTAGTHGGAIAVVGNDAAQVQVIIGVNEQHFDTNGNKINCDHDEKEANSLVQDAVLSCPIVSNNRVTATTNSGGGAVYVTEGNGTADETLLYIYCLTAKENAVNNTGTTESLSDFMLVEGGTVQVSTALNPTEQNQPATYGCIDITGNMHVVGGKVDLWGNTKNPLVNGIITVDIAEDEEWCRDHRKVDNGYTITYYENMGNDVMRYNSYPIASGEEIEIKGNIFNRPGYKLLGWNTSAGTQEDPLDEGTSCNDDNDVLGWYAAGSKHRFGSGAVTNCNYLHNSNLVLYAIWGANGYTVQFDANVPSGISYENNYPDKNASQVFNYDVEAPLIANQYFYPGHIFDGWTTNADGSGTVYTDTQPVKNLAQSGTVILYAQWNDCPHDNALDSRCTFTYTASGATLTKTCSCKAYSEGITISAENATYNGSVHDATLSTDTWGLSIQYKKGDKVLSGAPSNAGTYTASITAGGQTASVTYTIDKATQPAPVKPTFTVDGNKLTVNEVNPSEKASSDTAIKTMYQLVYYTGNTEGKSEAQETRTFTLDQAYTSYYVQVWYSAGTNHLASDVVKSTQTHYFEGYVRIDVNCDIGIAYQLIKNTGEGANGLSLDIRPESGYYLSDLKVEVDNVNTVITKLGSTESGWEVSYDITNIPTGTEGNTVVIQVNITGAKKAVSIDAQVVENQVFDTVTGDSTANITAASSYTAYFAVESYDSAAYSGLSVKFDPGLKNGTKVILQDKTNNTYWHYTATGNETSGEVALTAFKRMGAEEITYTLSGNSLKLQFVVDRVSANTVTSLVAAKTNSNAPDLNGSVTTNVDNNTAFVLNSTDNGTLTQTVTHTYTVTNSYTDTQWDYRHGALLLSEKTGTNLPADARISIAIGNAEAVYYKNGNNQFVIPLGEIGTGSADLTLMSDFIPDSGASYTLTAQWMASASIADLATGNGNLLGTIDVVFTSAAKTVPAVEINTENNNRLVTAGSTYDVTITYRDIPESYTASVRLYRAVQNENGEFDFAPAGGAQTISLPSTAQSISYKVSIPSDRTGSAYLCLELKDGLNVVKTVEHYFIIGEAPNNDESPNGNHI